MKLMYNKLLKNEKIYSYYLGVLIHVVYPCSTFTTLYLIAANY